MSSLENWNELEKVLKRKLQDLTPALEQWGSTVDKRIIEALTSAGFEESNIKIAPKHRLKGEGSFITKALYREKSKNYNDPIRDIEDKVATRLVVLTTEQIEQAQTILCAAPFWHAKIDKEISNEIELAPNSFSYQAAHLVVREVKGIDSQSDDSSSPIACEIQIKTLFQHAYSEMSHSTVYKGPYRQDTKLLRKLARSMALMEAVDEYFQDMYDIVGSGRSLPVALSKEMTVRFGQLWPEFNKNSVDNNLTISIFNKLYEDGDLTIPKLDEFVTRYTPNLQRIISSDRYYLSHQPVLIFVAYLMKNRKRFLERQWDFDAGILDEIAEELGVSRDEYDG